MDDTTIDPNQPVVRNQDDLLKDDDTKHQAAQTDQMIGEQEAMIGEQEAMLGGTMPVSGTDYDLDDERAKMGMKPQDPEHPAELNSEAELEASDSNNNR